ncbi:hypothetical protein [Microbacterium sp. ZW T5_56]|uniref:hypothetical protein n=1 Tax=Microbacterium sp. ZW T5_56 TaxID=3378081 RepID=UPI003852DA4D
MGQGQKATTKRGVSALGAWGIVALVGVGVWAVFFGIPAGIQTLKTPLISEDFGLEDAVVALRLDADDRSYLVLVNDAGETRSVQLDERGFEDSRLVWTENGLSTGGPFDEYVLDADDLRSFPLDIASESSSERARVATGDGFAVLTGSAEGAQLAFVDVEDGKLTERNVGYTSAGLTSCDGEAVLVSGDHGVRTVTGETEDLSGTSPFTGVGSVTCAGDRVYGLGEFVDAEDHETQTLQIWDRTTGEHREVEIRYPRSVLAWMSGTPFVWEGRLYWAAWTALWSVPVGPELGDSVTATETVDLGGFLDDVDVEIISGTGEGVLAAAGGRVYGVATDERFINPRRGASYDRLDRMTIFGADAASGERRIELELRGIDFPKRDIHVHAIAVNPQWAAER